MTKARFKRLLALVVALSLFACNFVVAFGLDSYFSFPYFSYYRVSYRNSHGLFNEYLKQTASFSPFSSVSDSVPESFDRLYFYLRFEDFVSSVSSSSKFHSNGVPAGYYTGSLLISSSDSVPSVYFDVTAPANNKAYTFDSSFTVYSNVGDVGFIVSFNFFVPSAFTLSSDELIFKFVFSDLISGSYTFTPSVLPDQSYYNLQSSSMTNVYTNTIIDISNSSRSPDNNDLYYFIQYLSTEISISGLRTHTSIHNDFMSFQSKLFPAINNLTSYFLSQKESDNYIYKQSVPNGLKQQQQEAQNQLTDYEQKEQAVFDNLNTSLNDLNLNDYSNFSPSIVSSMTFINRYVTAGFDGLGDFKIILFLPMVIGIGLAVIGRMGHMISNRPTGKGRGP